MKNIAKNEVCEIDRTSYEGLNRPIEFQHNALEEINVIAPWGYLPPHNLRIIVSVGCWVYAFATHCIEIYVYDYMSVTQLYTRLFIRNQKIQTNFDEYQKHKESFSINAYG